jgi:hypothetical protein
MSKAQRFTTRLVSPISYINIPFRPPEGGFTKLKILSMFYKTMNIDVETMLVDISSFNDGNYYLVNGTNSKYTILLPLNQQMSSLNFYLNKSTNINEFDFVRSEGLITPSFVITLLINGQLRSNEITALNPVILEIMLI